MMMLSFSRVCCSCLAREESRDAEAKTRDPSSPLGSHGGRLQPREGDKQGTLL